MLDGQGAHDTSFKIDDEKRFDEEKKRVEEERKKVYLENLETYRTLIANWEEQYPHCFDDMPGMTSISKRQEREASIVEDMSKISYSSRYDDSHSTYRHVICPKGIAKWIPPNRLMNEAEWRSLGVQQSPGWVHYMIHEPEPHILLFKRPLDVKEKKKE